MDEVRELLLNLERLMEAKQAKEEHQMVTARKDVGESLEKYLDSRISNYFSSDGK